MNKDKIEIIFNSTDCDFLKDIIITLMWENENNIFKLKKLQKTNIILQKENYKLFKILKERKGQNV